MSIVGIAAIVGTGLAVGSKLYSGFKAGGKEAGENLDDLREGARNIFDETKELVTRGYDVTVDTANIALEKAGNIKDFTVNKLGFGARKSVTDLKDQISTTTQKSDFATNKSLDAKADDARTTIEDQYGMNIDSAVDSYKSSEDMYNVSLRAADIKKDQGFADAMKSYQDRMGYVEEQPETFWEGFWT